MKEREEGEEKRFIREKKGYKARKKIEKEEYKKEEEEE